MNDILVISLSKCIVCTAHTNQVIAYRPLLVDLSGGSGTTYSRLDLSNLLTTDGTRTLTSGIVSSVPTFKALASSPSGASTIIQPNSIINYARDTTTGINYSSMTTNTLSMIG